MRRAAKAAGVVAPQDLRPVPTLAESASFATARYGDAFWLVRATDRGPGELFVSSGARVLRDLRAELGVSAGDPVWSSGVLNTLGDRLEAAGVAGRLPAVAAGAVVPVEWLRGALWFTYSRDQGVNTRIELPRLLELPRLGQALGASDEATHAATGFDPALLASNPWAVRGTGFEVESGGRAPVATRSKRGGATLALAALALLVVTSEG